MNDIGLLFNAEKVIIMVSLTFVIHVTVYRVYFGLVGATKSEQLMSLQRTTGGAPFCTINKEAPIIWKLEKSHSLTSR